MGFSVYRIEPTSAPPPFAVDVSWTDGTQSVSRGGILSVPGSFSTDPRGRTVLRLPQAAILSPPLALHLLCISCFRVRCPVGDGLGERAWGDSWRYDRLVSDLNPRLFVNRLGLSCCYET